MYDRQDFRLQEQSNKRYAGELVIPERKARHGRPGAPARVIPWGEMHTGTALLDRFGSPGEAVVTNPGYGLPEVLLRQRRIRRPDGSRGAPLPLPPDDATRIRARGDCEQEEAARQLIARALAAGEILRAGRRVRLFPLSCGSIRTIPDKGPVQRWASVEDLVQAIACGVF